MAALNLKRSRAMKKMWKRKRAEGTAKRKKDTTSTPTTKVTIPRMKVRVISQKDGTEIENYEIDTLGELFDILTGNYLGVLIHEVLIQTNSTLL
jgi:hypothetical protein